MWDETGSVAWNGQCGVQHMVWDKTDRGGDKADSAVVWDKADSSLVLR